MSHKTDISLENHPQAGKYMKCVGSMDPKDVGDVLICSTALWGGGECTWMGRIERRHLDVNG